MTCDDAYDNWTNAQKMLKSDNFLSRIITAALVFPRE